jgi:hypothetical protein
MNYPAAITDYMKSPKWVMNTLLAAVCCLIPIVGGIVVAGWLITGFWGRKDEAPETFPDFDFGKFGTWLQRGLWPVVVAIASIGAVMLVLTIFNGILGFIGSQAKFLSFVTFLVSTGASLAVMVGVIFAVKPLVLKAIFEQDFVKAFDIAFVKKFVSLVWIEMLIATLFLMAVSIALSIAGMIALCVGIFLTPPITGFVAMHLDKQLYNLYLTRGGPPLAMSPLLSDAPAPLPVA